jgi:competence protein CoiA
MLTARRRSDQETAVAWLETRDRLPWECPACRSEVSLKKGMIRVHHFAHRPPVTCEYGAYETEQHRRCKKAIHDLLAVHPRVTDCRLERDVGAARPDVSARIDGEFVAIEVQASTLGLERIIARTKTYAAKGIPVLWLGIWDSDLATGRYAPAAWERWLHAAYFGRVYYWREDSGLALIPVHFGEHLLHVEHREWRSEGEEHSAGGYDRVSRRYRTPSIPTQRVDVVTGMHTSRRTAWSGGSMHVPECLLRCDTISTWWA